jgi:hypothetical protein
LGGLPAVFSSSFIGYYSQNAQNGYPVVPGNFNSNHIADAVSSKRIVVCRKLFVVWLLFSSRCYFADI